MDYRYTMEFNCGGGAYSNISNLINTHGIPSTIIEVGVFEGRTTCWMADSIAPHNPKLKIYAVDPHVGSSDMEEDFDMVRSNFLHNIGVSKYGQSIEHINKPSFPGLIELLSRGVMAELIYIDGDHRAAGVLEDLVLAWRLLGIGGVMLCDDTTTWKYQDRNGTYSGHMSPRLAVETFIQCNWDKIKMIALPDGTQTAFMKMKE